MWRSNLWKMSGVFSAVFIVLTVAGCYTQLRTDVFSYESEGKRPRADMSEEDLILRTDRPWYQSPPAEAYVTVGVTFENNGNAPVLLAGCPDPPSVVIEEWDGTGWVRGAAIGFACFGTYSLKTVEIGPGESFEFQISFSDTGWYRLRLAVGPEPNRPATVAYSNQFLMR